GSPQAFPCSCTCQRLGPKLFRKSRDRAWPFRHRPTLPCRAPAPRGRGIRPGTWPASYNARGPPEAKVASQTRARRQTPVGGTCKERPPADEDDRTALSLLRRGQAPPTVQDGGILHGVYQL